MDKSLSAPGPDDSILTVAAHFAQHVAAEKHAALLENSGKFDLLQRKAALLNDGVAAVLGSASAKAELLALCFQVRKFTPAEAVNWLAEAGDFDAHWSLLMDKEGSIRHENTRREPFQRRTGMTHQLRFRVDCQFDFQITAKPQLDKIKVRAGEVVKAQVRPFVQEGKEGPVECANLLLGTDGTVRMEHFEFM